MCYPFGREGRVWLWTQTQPLTERSVGYPRRLQLCSTRGVWLSRCDITPALHDAGRGRPPHGWPCWSNHGRLRWVGLWLTDECFPEPGYPRVYSRLVCAFKCTLKPPAYIINYVQLSSLLDSKSSLRKAKTQEFHIRVCINTESHRGLWHHEYQEWAKICHVQYLQPCSTKKLCMCNK